MKRIKVLLMLAILVILSGCTNKFEGTWCKYSDVATTLVILSNDISDNDLNKITTYIAKLSNLKSYDIIDKIEEASKMITIYYKDENKIEVYEKDLKNFTGVKTLKSSKMNTVVDKLVLKNSDYTFGKSLNSLDAQETKGKYKENGNSITLDNGINFYYKDKFLCYDEGCNDLMSKAKGNDCY